MPNDIGYYKAASYKINQNYKKFDEERNQSLLYCKYRQVRFVKICFSYSVIYSSGDYQQKPVVSHDKLL